jgi:hypothetical protein
VRRVAPELTEKADEVVAQVNVIEVSDESAPAPRCSSR